MAFTFLVEDGTGIAGANSYVAVAEAEDILTIDNTGLASWDAMVDADKELNLAKATRYLDDNYQWFGRKATHTQSLKWPRCGMRDDEGCYIADGVIPIELKRATARLAIWLMTNNGEDAMNMDGIKSFRSDDVEIEWQAGASTLKAPDFLAKLLITFGWGPNDRGFKPILRK